MLHDIAPAAYNNDISFRAPVLEDKIIIYRGKQVLTFVEGGTMRAPLFADFFDESELESMRAIYLFAVGEDVYFMAEVPDETIDAALARQPYDASSEMDGWAFLPLQKLIEYHPKRERFALMVGHEYWNWYESSRYCGRCGAKTEHDRVERMMRCPACGLMIFPKVSQRSSLRSRVLMARCSQRAIKGARMRTMRLLRAIARWGRPSSKRSIVK